MHLINSKAISLVVILFLCIFGLLFGLYDFYKCKKKIKPIAYSISGTTMGTTYSVLIKDHKIITPSQLFILKRKIDVILERINDSMSTYKKISTISKFNHYCGIDAFFIGLDMAYVVRNALHLSKLSNGAFDITSGPLIDLWGFDLSDRNLCVPKNKDIKMLCSHIGLNKIIVMGEWLKKFNSKIKINLSGIAKGYGVDILYQFIKKSGFKNFMVEIGGEIRVKNENKTKK